MLYVVSIIFGLLILFSVVFLSGMVCLYSRPIKAITNTRTIYDDMNEEFVTTELSSAVFSDITDKYKYYCWGHFLAILEETFEISDPYHDFIPWDMSHFHIWMADHLKEKFPNATLCKRLEECLLITCDAIMSNKYGFNYPRFDICEICFGISEALKQRAMLYERPSEKLYRRTL